LAIWRVEFKEELGFVCTKAKQSIAGALALWRESSMIIFLLLFGLCKPCKL
jgi:hypothetical protein